MSITGEPEGESMKLGVAVVDRFTAMNAASGILAALANRDRFVAMLAEIIKRHPRAWGSERLDAAGVACGPINRLDEVFADPQLLSRGMVPGEAGSLRMVGNPLQSCKRR